MEIRIYSKTTGRYTSSWYEFGNYRIRLLYLGENK
tara:strand:- start:3301 stop:3405 length:105 start_codon:yes stop_codon:yes gene_type:complete